MGPVVDVKFDTEKLPRISDALVVYNHGEKCTMEVRQHIRSDTVRCIMLSASEGLAKGIEVEATGSPITAPVGEACLGRLFNVTGEAIDGLPSDELDKAVRWTIHRKPPEFSDQSPVGDPGNRHKGHRSDRAVCEGRQDRALRRCRCRQDGAHSGAYQECGDRARRLFHLYRSR